jgi:hypothetical protein
MSLLLLLGFGLLTAYIRNSKFSGLGYTLLIAAVTIQFYFLVNAFFTKLQIQPTTDSFDSAESVTLGINKFYSGLTGNTFMDAYMCAIAIYVAYAAIHGRVGPLHVFILTLLGVVGYELNSQIMTRCSMLDVGGSMKVFVFGSTLGLVVSYMLDDRG